MHFVGRVMGRCHGRRPEDAPTIDDWMPILPECRAPTGRYRGEGQASDGIDVVAHEGEPFGVERGDELLFHPTFEDIPVTVPAKAGRLE